MNNAIVIHLGGHNASNLYSAIRSDNIKNHFYATNRISVATNGFYQEMHGNLLIVIGTPLPFPVQIPGSWQAAMKELTRYDGVFIIFYWDSIAEKLVVCTDFLGLQPLYWTTSQEGVYFSSHTKLFNGDYDPAGWGAFLSLGYTLGNKTLTAGIERVPPASIIAVDAETRKIDCQNYWRLGARSFHASTSDVYEALNESMEKTVPAARFDHVLLMSGGFDSRLIACLLTRRKQQFHAVLVSHYDENLDAESRFANAMAKRLGFDCNFHAPARDFFSSSAYLDYLFESDSEIPSLYLFIAQVLQYVPANSSVWDGLLPGATLNLLPGASQPMSTRQEAPFFVTQGRGYDSAIWQAARQIFAERVAEQMWQSFQDNWAKEISKYMGDSDRDETSCFLLANRVRNRTGPNPFKVYQSKAQPLTPGMTRDYVECTMSIPHEKKKNHRFYREIFRRYFPEALEVPIVHGNTIERPEHFSPGFELFSILNHLHNSLKRRPRLMRYFGMNPSRYGFMSSSFLSLNAIYNENDPALNHEFLATLKAGDPAPPETLELLFHWRVWRWLHAGKLFDYLG